MSDDGAAAASGEAVLYGIPGSHPAHTGQLMLELKGIPFRRVNLVPGFHRPNDVLQQWARRMVIEAGIRDPDLLHERGGAGRMGPLLFSRDRPRRQMARLVKIAYGMTSAQFRHDQTRVDEMLDRVDELIAAGVLNGEQLNCADLQVATSLALIEYRMDVRGELRRRSGAQLMERVLPGPG